MQKPKQVAGKGVTRPARHNALERARLEAEESLSPLERVRMEACQKRRERGDEFEIDESPIHHQQQHSDDSTDIGEVIASIVVLIIFCLFLYAVVASR